MAMPPRIILLSAIGIILYLGLSLYHGHQLKKYPLMERGGGKALSARAEEKTWVQVSTIKQGAAGPVQPQGAQGVPVGATGEPPAGIAGGGNRPASGEEQPQGIDPAAAPDDQQVLLAALQAELLQSRALLENREEELRKARMQLDKTLEEKQQAVDSARALGEELTPARTEQELQAVEIGRLRTELKEARARAAVAEGELERARLKAEAMFRYGQEQSRLLAPSRQEVEILQTRLAETRDKLAQAEQLVADLRNREQLLQRELDGLRGAGHEEKAHGAAAEGENGTTPAAKRAD